MIFSVSVFKRGKSGPVISKVDDILADRFVVENDHSAFGVSFYNDDKKFMRDTQSTLVAFLPGHDWIIKG